MLIYFDCNLVFKKWFYNKYLKSYLNKKTCNQILSLFNYDFKLEYLLSIINEHLLYSNLFFKRLQVVLNVVFSKQF